MGSRVGMGVRDLKNALGLMTEYWPLSDALATGLLKSALVLKLRLQAMRSSTPVKAAVLSSDRFTHFWIVNAGCVLLKIYSDATPGYPPSGRLAEKLGLECSKNKQPPKNNILHE